MMVDVIFVCFSLRHWQFVGIVMLLDWLQLATNPGLMPKYAQHRAPEELEALDTLGDSLNVTAQQPTEPSAR